MAGLVLAAAVLGSLPLHASAQNEDTQPLYQLHGSGTSNPALLVWRAMDTMMARTKPRVAMSYRSVGSGSGAADFLAGANAFGCGDVPLPNTTYNAFEARGETVMHVPFLVGSVSVFHNVPGVGEGLFLPPCLLARIFRGDVSNWNHPDIVSNNTQLPDLANIVSPIRIVHRNPGSSSTYALTHYFAKACPSEWTAVPGCATTKTGDASSCRSVGVTTEWPADAAGRWKTGQNSQEIMENIAAVPYSLGYVESGQGLNAGLAEVEILSANGTRLASSDADVASASFIAEQFPLSDLASRAWVDVNPVYASPGNPRQWPLVLGTYFYVHANATFLEDVGGLLKLFLNYMLSADVASQMKDYFFTPLSAENRTTVLNSVNSLLTLSSTSTIAWRQESVTNNTFGQQNFVFSSRRDSYLMNTVAGLAIDTAEAKRTLALGDAYQVHGSGSFVSAVLLRHSMAVLQSRARVPISMTYRAVGSVEAQEEFADYAKMYHSYNHFKVSDMPLESAIHTALSSTAARAAITAPLQLPFAVSALGLYYNKALPSATLVLSCPLVARLYTGALTSWADAALVSANGFSASASQTLLAANVTVFGIGAPSGPTWALTGWLAKSCADVWTGGQVTNATWAAAVSTSYKNAAGTTVLIRTPDDMLAAIAATPGSIGYLPAPLGATSGLAEVALDVSGGTPGASPIRSGQANLTRAITQAQAAVPGLFTNATIDLAAAMAPPAFPLYGQPNSWPMPMVQYMLVYRNLAGYGYSGPLLRAFAEFLLGAEGSQLATEHGLTPMPSDVASAMRRAVSLSELKTLTVVWSAETAGTYDDSGSGLYTFSSNRDGYETWALAALQSEVRGVQERLAMALPATLRVACTPDTYGFTRLLRGDLQDMSSTNLRLLDEMLPASSSINALRAAVAGAAGPTHMIVHPGPLPSVQWRQLAGLIAVAQVPAFIRPVALVYKGAAGLRLSPCTLARIIKGEVKTWDDAAVKADNPGILSLPSNAIALLTAGADDADARAVLQYVVDAATNASCTAGLALPTGNQVANEEIVSKVASAQSYSGLGLVAAAGLVSEAAFGAGLAAVELPSVVSGTYGTPTQTAALRNSSTCPASGCGGAVAKAYGAALEEMLTSTGGGPNAMGAPAAGDLTGDWSSFRVRPFNVKPSTDVYPIFRLDFFVGPADLSIFGEDGAVVRVAQQYGSGALMAERINLALGPYFAGLGPKAREVLVAPGLANLRTAPDAATWSIVGNSAEQASATNPAATVVQSRVPSTMHTSLPGSDAGSVYRGVFTTPLGRGDVQVIAEQSVRDMTSDLLADQDKLNLAYDIGVAALVLGLVLSLTALVLAVYAVSVVRSERGKGGSGCLTPAAKYDKHIDAPAEPHVEMQVHR